MDESAEIELPAEKLVINIPEPSVVVLIGASSAGKSTFASRHFLPTQVLSSDNCRALITDDENNQAITKEAFELLHLIAHKRLTAGKLCVIDATNVQRAARRPFVELARQYQVSPVAIVLDTPEKLIVERNAQRPDRNLVAHVVENQWRDLQRSLRDLNVEGFKQVVTLSSLEDLERVTINLVPRK